MPEVVAAYGIHALLSPDGHSTSRANVCAATVAGRGFGFSMRISVRPMLGHAATAVTFAMIWR
jgi:hypothetical protein